MEYNHVIVVERFFNACVLSSLASCEVLVESTVLVLSTLQQILSGRSWWKRDRLVSPDTKATQANKISRDAQEGVRDGGRGGKKCLVWCPSRLACSMKQRTWQTCQDVEKLTRHETYSSHSRPGLT